MAKKKTKKTPMMEQYDEIRSKLPPNCLLLFRLGDFYELFGEDAQVGSQIMGLTLTKRNDKQMAGLPYHAADGYIQKALNAGKKVAICEQMEAPKAGQLVKRGLTRILTPATTLEDHQIDAKHNQYMLAIARDKNTLTASWLDLTTGEFQISASEDVESLVNHFHALDPKELILYDDALKSWREDPEFETVAEELQQFAKSRAVSELPDFHFDPRDGAKLVMETLGVLNLEGFGINLNHPALGPAGALIHYASENLCARPQNIQVIKEYKPSNCLQIDPATQRNLEIFKSSQGIRKESLLEAMDATATAPGTRLLESYLTNAPLDLDELKRRQNCVETFLEFPAYCSELSEYLKGVRDIPRILGRLRNRIRNPRELGGIRETLRQLPDIISVLEQFEGKELSNLITRISENKDIRDLLEASLLEELPNNLLDGNFIAHGYDEELDHFRNLNKNSKEWLANLEADEVKRTGIKNLKIKYNNAFGYFIEITKSNLSLVPENYIRKQTMTNAERYFTPELKEKETEILQADEKAIALEEKLFKTLVDQVLEKSDELEATALALAEIDLFSGWAKIAREWNYCKPALTNTDELKIEGGRHPVVEQMMRFQRLQGLPGEHDFVPNDTFLSSSDEQIAIITGPNMAGKSTYIRQVALISLMAQVGSWVPADSCELGLIDRIFSRVGASDELSRGNSTFMVEMNETANIINNATAKSLIILDEIGRGTSTYDGLSIAWAVVEHLHGETNTGPKTLFATHYHELTQIAEERVRIRNYSVTVKEWNDSIIFVRQVKKGAADRSYGIQVARLAGLPTSIIDRAKDILHKLESEDSSHNLIEQAETKPKPKKKKVTDPSKPQLELF